jgi:1-deoxy-D-xylulose-5-phosphate reductoisomerase
LVHSISILGSTGSIGTQTLEVARSLGLRVDALAAGGNVTLLAEQARLFHPRLLSTATAEGAIELTALLSGCGFPVEVMHGDEGVRAVATFPASDRVVAAMVGVAGLVPVLAALEAGKGVALANKETLVAGGSLVMPLVRKKGLALNPVDSEHSAIWQCLWGAPEKSLSRILLTASGGPFRGRDRAGLEGIGVEQALAHPTWRMGGKITIDSATLMNKGLEVIEASWLFDVSVDKVVFVVHPQSIIHSMVEFVDGSVLAQIGRPDMKLPIQVALSHPDRVAGDCVRFDPFECGSLTFERPDPRTFRCLDLAYWAGRTGGSLPAVMNSANEEAVALFLEGRIGFLDIPRLVEQEMEAHMASGFLAAPDLATVLSLDVETRRRMMDRPGSSRKEGR